MEDLLSRTIEIAIAAHKDQEDKIGKPYILHPLRVMLSVNSLHDMQVAILHDVIEDTSVGITDLIKEGIPVAVVDSIIAMTKRKDESYNTYLHRVYLDKSARRVKIADIKDNCRPERLFVLDQKTIDRLTRKYSKALKFLEGWE